MFKSFKGFQFCKRIFDAPENFISKQGKTIFLNLTLVALPEKPLWMIMDLICIVGAFFAAFIFANF